MPKITDASYPAITDVQPGDILVVVDDPSGTPVVKRATVADVVLAGLVQPSVVSGSAETILIQAGDGAVDGGDITFQTGSGATTAQQGEVRFVFPSVYSELFFRYDENYNANVIYSPQVLRISSGGGVYFWTGDVYFMTSDGASEMARIGPNGLIFPLGNGRIDFGEGYVITEPIRSGVLNLIVGGSTSGATISSAPAEVSITGNTDNWDVGVPSRYCRVAANGAYSITGLMAGEDGEERELWNVSAHTLTIPHESGSSDAANRWCCHGSANIAWAPNNLLQIRYDGTTQRWRAR